ncbi:uncharacterized protein BCR38DRAFT_340359 [Pseudomassariella vexata]|uniref:Pre-mRNA splicing factor CLF1 n=1 Tax=Pseudomassariella vexata TaxID=1141098 RepID=A0A1Y2E2Q0_9PEZI|nr:uncharacterized protein BCR38DRAFT_340359 [Pseudomassariella vexata]ORY65820.1 hypothetical protein BCR38DRAFT_340359 [Pseudomassariella vexata]
MTLPQPEVSLTGACSVIYNNTLYEYSQSAFQSLALEEGAEWETLANGHSVEGGVCVGSTPTNTSEAGLYVVGGTSSDSEYKGLQKFTYATGKWQSIEPQVAVTQSRVWHSATYLNNSDTILIYAGSQDGEQHISSQTFTVGAKEPYTVLAYQSSAPPAIAPILLPWSDTQAVMLGGDATNSKVMLFESGTGWTDSGCTLADPITKNTTEVKAVMMTGDDGSKHLYTFDLSVSPNTVNRTVLKDGSGAAIVGAAPVSKRDLDANNWPQYNSTLAPKDTRSQYSLAVDSAGLVVMSGGNDDDVLCLFDGKQNRWNNATALLGSKQVSIQSLPTSSPTSTATASLTSTASATESATESPTTVAAAATSTSSGLPPTTILGIALGIIFGVAILLIGLLFLIKRKRQRQSFVEAGHSRRDSGIPNEKGFVRDMAQATGPQFRGHAPQDSAGSFSSVAILMGKVHNKPETKRSSGSSMSNKAFKSSIGRPQQLPATEPDYTPEDEKAVAFAADANPVKPRNGPVLNRDGERRSSGWNRYWSGGSTLNMLGFGSAGAGSGSRRETGVSEQSSHYSDPHRMTQDSATVPPLQLDLAFPVPPLEGRPEFNRVNSGSPTVSHYTDNLKEGMSGQIERPISSVSSSGYSSGIPPSVHETWDPTIAKEPWGSNRAPSSIYSAYPTALGAPGTSRPPNGISRQPPLAKASVSSDMSWLNLGEQNRQFG